MVELNIEFVTQHGGLPNDCGQAVSSMVVRAFTDKRPTLRDMGFYDGEYKALWQVQAMLTKFGIASTLVSNQTVNWYKDQIRAGTPVIALVNYLHIGGVRFGHYVLVTGFTDKTVIILDPYQAVNGRLEITNEKFHLATTDIKPYAQMPYAILPKVSMPVRKFSYNVHANYIGLSEWLSFKQHIQAIRPAHTLVMDNLWRAQELKPYTNVIFRKYEKDDAWQNETPENWFYRHLPYARDHGFTLYVLNEPGQHHPNLPGFLLRVAQLCVQHRVKAVLGNFSEGVPDNWERFLPLLRYIAENPDLLALGLHEYFAGVPWFEYSKSLFARPVPGKNDKTWHIGRYKQLPFPVPVIITEAGPDSIKDPNVYPWQRSLPGYEDRAGYHVTKRWWESAGLDPQRFAGEALEWLMKYYYTEPWVKGVLYYCIGGEGEWVKYDIHKEKDLLERIKNMQEMTAPAASPFRVEWVDNSGLNVRANPTTASTRVGVLYKNDTLVSVSDFASAGGFVWRKIKTTRGLEGWIATNAVRNFRVRLD